MLRTRMNGGTSSLKDVAEAWNKDAHDFPWSDVESEKWTVEFVKGMKAERLKQPAAVPHPMNIHKG